MNRFEVPIATGIGAGAGVVTHYLVGRLGARCCAADYRLGLAHHCDIICI